MLCFSVFTYIAHFFHLIVATLYTRHSFDYCFSPNPIACIIILRTHLDIITTKINITTIVTCVDVLYATHKSLSKLPNIQVRTA